MAYTGLNCVASTWWLSHSRGATASLHGKDPAEAAEAWRSGASKVMPVTFWLWVQDGSIDERKKNITFF